MSNKRVIWAGLAAGVLCHILQGIGAYLFFDLFYLENPDILRDAGFLVGPIYLAVNLIVGLVISHLAFYLKAVWDDPDWLVGMKAAFFVWAASSPVFIVKRQVILKLSYWLLLEILSDLIIYLIIGALAGFLCGRGISERPKPKEQIQ